MYKKIMLAPMAGVTDYPFRKITRQFGAQYTISEMTVSNALIRNIDRNEFYHNEGVQLAGNDPHIMSQAAQIVQDKGAEYININMGCPMKKIAINSYAGAALLRDSKLALEILNKIIQSVKIKVTVKMRTGWDSENILPLVQEISKLNIKEIIIHGRTRNQMYSGLANWEYIYKIKESMPNISIIGNGDIKSIYDAKDKINILDGIMIGRGSYGKPWLINQIDQYINHNIIVPDPDLKEQKEILLEHINEIIKFYGIDRGLLIARKHICWYTKSLQDSAQYRMKINQSLSLQENIRLIEELYDLQ